MAVVSLGDLAQSYSLRQRNSSLKQEMNRLTTELTTGQVADLRQVLAGNYSYLTDIERKTEMLLAYKVATSEAAQFSGAMQITLDQLDRLSQNLSSSLLTAGTSSGGVNVAQEARSALNGMIGTLNTDVAGRHLFSGAATDRPPLVDTGALLNELKIAIGTAATPDEIIVAANAWFEAPTGYVAFAYQGANEALSPFAISQSENVALDIRGTDPGIRKILQLTAIAALADDPSFGLTKEDQSELYSRSGQQMLQAQDDITMLRANIGFAEARIDRVTARNSAEFTSLGFAKTALLEVDPFETATQLEEVQFQLQSLYSVTVRMSQLSLVNFL